MIFYDKRTNKIVEILKSGYNINYVLWFKENVKLEDLEYIGKL